VDWGNGVDVVDRGLPQRIGIRFDPRARNVMRLTSVGGAEGETKKTDADDEER
jgi:hypothetical protein